MSSVLKVIENRDLDLETTDYYAAILGESPSKGAKSPSLWNEAFHGLGLSGVMHPMDVAPEKLGEVVRRLRNDRRFIGGAVTMPYKISIIPHLDGLEPEAERIGAVNCIYRDGEKIIGSNTDGAGAIWSLTEEMNDLSGKSALLLGTGGAGYAVAAYTASAIGPKGRLKLANRSRQTRDELVRRLEGKCGIGPVDWPLSLEDVADVDILINCTNIGFETFREDGGGVFTLKFYTPLGPVDDAIRVNRTGNEEKQFLKRAHGEIISNIGRSIEILAAMNAPFVFDIIYQPLRTMLLSLAGIVGYKTLNGAPMNLEQAVIAFRKATSAAGLRDAGNSEIRDLMVKVW